MNTQSQWIIPFAQIRRTDHDRVGGKNASLGEMTSQLKSQGIRVPEGFALTTQAFEAFLNHNDLTTIIAARLEHLDRLSWEELICASRDVRGWIMGGVFPSEIETAVHHGLLALAEDGSSLFAVRSSATAEDAPDHSFAGQQETFLNVSCSAVLDRVREVFASLYHERALSYRIHKGLAHHAVLMSVGIQRMVCSDDIASGVMFTLHTESGFPDVILIHATYGLGETLVQGAVNPDEFWVFKPSVRSGKDPILCRALGSKHVKMVDGCADRHVDVSDAQRARFAIDDADVIRLARYGMIIEEHYGSPMDIEWAKDTQTGQIYILQARPETVKSRNSDRIEHKYILKDSGKVLATGQAIGQKIGTGAVRLIKSFDDIALFQAGDVLVTDTTHPQWEPAMKRASAIITNRGGRTCHAAIVARELGVPAVVGCGHATDFLQEGMMVTVSCAEGEEGHIYEGALAFEKLDVETLTSALPPSPVPIMINLGNPQQAFHHCQYPQEGVGLARLEFIINRYVGIHPQAALAYPYVDAPLKAALDHITQGYATPRDFYVAKLTEGIATIAAAFYPKPVIVRFSDFKSHEYKKLVGGDAFEPDEENPMLGFRGVSRYLSDTFAPSFALECEAMRHVRERMGLDNVQVMVPFVRTLDQAKRVIALLAHHGLERGREGLRVIMMCELPSNAVLAEQFLEHFDGFSIGSNDMTQLTLGLDRDSGLSALNHDFNERDPAVLFLLARAIQACRAQGKYVGICGQGPSDHLDFARWLVEQGVSSLSLNPDSVMSTWKALTQ